MKLASRYLTLAALAGALLLGVRMVVAEEGGSPAGKTTLPQQTGTHFFEVYHCGELAGIVWITPGEAALYRVENLGNPELRKIASDLRAKARDKGTAFAVHGNKGGCSET